MPLYLDIHEGVEGMTAEAMEEAHQKDLAVQDKYGVRYLKYWFNVSLGKSFCLIDAPNAEACQSVHREAHGFLANEIIEVTEGQ